MSYFYALGGLSTDKPFIDPTMELLQKWYQEWSSKYDLSNYEVILSGSSAEYFFGPGILVPKDVDIILMNDIKDPKQLYDMMYGGVSIGYKHRLLVDIFHATDLHDPDIFIPYEQTRFYRTVTSLGNRGQRVVKDLGSKKIIKEYDCGLVTYNRNEETNSYKKRKLRTQNKIYEGVWVNLKTYTKWK